MITLVGSGMREIPPKGYGAVEKYVWNVYREMKKLNVSVEVLNRIFIKNPIGEYIFAIYALKKSRKSEIVHVNTSGVGFVFSITGRRFIYTSHSRHLIDDKGLRGKYGRFVENYNIKHAEKVIFLNPDIAQKYGKGKYTVIPNGVDIELFHPEYGNRTGKNILSLGEIARHKNFHITANALKDLDVNYTIIGPVKDRAYARELENLNVHLTGEIDENEIAKILSGGDVFLHPSESEALSMAVIEAMASGLPVIGSDINKQIVNGYNGISISSSLPIKDKMIEYNQSVNDLLNDRGKRLSMSENARKFAVENYSWEKIVKKILEFYYSVQ